MRAVRPSGAAPERVHKSARAQRDYARPEDDAACRKDVRGHVSLMMPPFSQAPNAACCASLSP